MNAIQLKQKVQEMHQQMHQQYQQMMQLTQNQTHQFGGGSKRTKRKKEKRKVSVKQREKCARHLSQVAIVYMTELGKLCSQLDLVNKGSHCVEFDIFELEDEKAQKLVDFVKRKMQLIITSKNNKMENQMKQQQHQQPTDSMLFDNDAGSHASAKKCDHSVIPLISSGSGSFSDIPSNKKDWIIPDVVVRIRQ